MPRRFLTALFGVLVCFSVGVFSTASLATRQQTDQDRVNQAKALMAQIVSTDQQVLDERTHVDAHLDAMLAALGPVTPPPPPPPPPPPDEVCGNGIDDDGDGQIDEGCQPPPPPPSEVCGDGIDNDKDGQIDEGCPPPPPPPTGTYPLYDDCMAAGANKLDCISLRSSSQLATKANGGYAYCNACPLDVTYDAAKDAAKAVVGTGSNSMRNQLRIPIKAYAGSLLLIWDAWYSPELADEFSGIPTYKHFQIASASAIWTEVRSRFSQATGGDIAKVDLRYYGASFGPGTTKGPDDTLAPVAGTFITKPQAWTRYFVFLNPAGTYTEVSLWAADENRDPVQLLDKRLIQPKSGGRWNEWWLELNTSTDTVKAGRPPLVSYYRNLLMYQGLSDAEVSARLLRP